MANNRMGEAIGLGLVAELIFLAIYTEGINMKSLLLILFFSLPQLLFASELNELNNIQVSRTFSIKIPYKLSTQVELPSLNSKLYFIEGDKLSSSQILVLYNKPKTFATKFSVERYWKKSREQTKAIDKKEINHGCIQKTVRTHQCSRDVTQDEKFIAESMFWNTKSDLVLIRVTSLNSFSDARKILEKIKISQNTRWPAGGSK